MIPYGRQDIDAGDIGAVVAALADSMITQGPRVQAFETALARAVGAGYAVAFSSGTAALHAAYFAAGVGPGAGVLTTPITFAATANAALYLGGHVVFSDVDPSHAMLDVSAMDSVGSDGVHVVTPVHLAGHVAAMEELDRIARGRGWLVVEDACHALGARYHDVGGREHLVGSCAHSVMCCFSFHPVKHITTGEGGAVTTNDESLYRRLKRFRTHGITRDREELAVSDEGPWYYEQLELGYNYRITDFQCALGSSQLARLSSFVERRREIAAQYDRSFGAAGVRHLTQPHASRGSYHLYVVRVSADRRRSIFERLRKNGIGVNVHYLPVYRHPYYRAAGFDGFALPEAESYYSEAISIPMFPSLTDREVEHVADVVIAEVARG